MTPASSSPPPRRRARAARLAVLLGLLLAAAGLTQYAGAAAQPSPTPRVSAAVAVAEDGGRGQQVYLRDCAWCHGTAGGGTQFGPSLEESGGAAADFYLRTGRMPLHSTDEEPEPGPPSYPDATITALVDYVDALGTGVPVPELAPGDPRKGRGSFLANCAACHSSSGTGVIVSGGEDAPQLYDTPPRQVAEAVRIGPGPMPHFGEKQVDAEELDDIVAYVQQLGPRQVEAGLPLDQFGPIAEGAFALVVVLPLLVVVLLLLGKRSKP